MIILFNMKIALVHDSLLKVGGAEKTLKALSEIFPESPIYTSLYDKEALQGFFSYDRIKTSFLQKKLSFFKKRYKYLLPLLPTAFEEFDFSEFDVVISSSSSFAKGIIVPSKTIHINYCHTPTRFLWDSYHSYLKEQNLNFITRFFTKKLLHKTRIWDRAAADRVDYFISNSKNVSRRISKYYQRKSTVIYPPVNTQDITYRENHADFFLIVSRLEKYKQIEIAIKAFNQIPQRRLIIIGEGNQKRYLEKIAGPNIQFLGYKNDTVVKEYYQNCRIFIATAIDEDFGITPVEAMAAGKPVLALSQGGYRETIIHKKTGILYKENSPKSLLEGLVQILETDFNTKYIRDHSTRFSTDTFKNNIKEFIEKMI